MQGSLWLTISYLALTVFAIGFVWRAIAIARLPVHLRWELAPVPHEKGRGRYGGSYLEEYEWWTKPRQKSLSNEMVYMFKEIVLLRGVWENNRSLWYFSFPFHIGMYLLTGMFALMILCAAAGLAGFAAQRLMAPPILGLAAAGYGLGLVGAGGLFISRLTSPRLSVFSTRDMFFNLIFLLTVFATGGYALLDWGHFAAQMTHLMQALITADFALRLPAALAAHVVAGLLFLAYLPFTQMMHFVAKYFTYHCVRWDDRPMPGDRRMEKEVQTLLKQPVTWQAPHLKANGQKNWVDIATEGPEK